MIEQFHVLYNGWRSGIHKYSTWVSTHCSLSSGTAVTSAFWLLCLDASLVHWCNIISMVHVGGSALLPL